MKNKTTPPKPYTLSQELFFMDSVNAGTHIQYQIKPAMFLRYHLNSNYAYIEYKDNPRVLVSVCNISTNFDELVEKVKECYYMQIKALKSRIEYIEKEMQHITLNP